MPLGSLPVECAVRAGLVPWSVPPPESSWSVSEKRRAHAGANNGRMATSGKTTKREDASADKFTAEERAAMKERAQELKAAKGGKKTKVDDTQAVLDKIADMPEPDRAMAQRVHEVVMAAVPDLAPRLWYGMPSYAKDGKVLLFFQDAAKFKARYATLGFQDNAALDDGNMWPTSFAIVKLTEAVEKQIAELVKQAAG